MDWSRKGLLSTSIGVKEKVLERSSVVQYVAGWTASMICIRAWSGGRVRLLPLLSRVGSGILRP
jgi:hypothetical protein